MRKWLVSFAMSCFTIAICFSQQIEKEILYFNFGKRDLSTSSKKTIDDLLQNIQNKDISLITLAGHTDSDGSDRYNLKLSKNRVATVHVYLTSKGVVPEKITVAHYGKSHPIAPNNTEEGKQKNRRVEITVKFNGDSINVKNVVPSREFINKTTGRPCQSLIQLTEKDILYFNYGKHEMTEISKAYVRSLLNKLNNYNIVQIDLAGHTDGDGSINFNLKLSQERVNIVQLYLTTEGILNEQINGSYFGKSQPIASNATEAGKQKNRRVEMIIKFNDCIDQKKNDPASPKATRISISENTDEAQVGNKSLADDTRQLNNQRDNSKKDGPKVIETNTTETTQAKPLANISLVENEKDKSIENKKNEPINSTDITTNTSINQNSNSNKPTETPDLSTNGTNADQQKYSILTKDTSDLVNKGLIREQEVKKNAAEITSEEILTKPAAGEESPDSLKIAPSNSTSLTLNETQNEPDEITYKSYNINENDTKELEQVNPLTATATVENDGMKTEAPKAKLDLPNNDSTRIQAIGTNPEKKAIDDLEAKEDIHIPVASNLLKAKTETNNNDSTAIRAIATSPEGKVIDNAETKEDIHIPTKDKLNEDSAASITTPIIPTTETTLKSPQGESQSQNETIPSSPLQTDSVENTDNTTNSTQSEEKPIPTVTTAKIANTTMPTPRIANMESNYTEVHEEKIAHLAVNITMNDSIKNNRSDSVHYRKTQPEIVSTNNVQTFTVSAQEEIILEGKQGTVITIPKNSLVDKSGEPVNDDVRIELQEVYTKADMLNNNIQTASEGNLIESGGMVNVQITKPNSEMILLASNSSYQVELPTRSKQKDMELFYGKHTGDGLDWLVSDRAPDDSTFNENRKLLDKYVFRSSQLGWINVDRFVGMNNRTNLRVNLNITNEVNVCLVFKRLNSVLNMTNKKKDILFSHIPLAEEATLIAFSKNGNEIFYASKSIVIAKDMIEDLTLERLTEAEFQERIKQFN